MGRTFITISTFLIFCACFSSQAIAQQAQNKLPVMEFSGESLSEALDKIIRETDINLVYDPQLTEEIFIYKRINPKNTEDLLKQLLADHQLDYITLSSGTYVIVRSVREGPFYGTLSGKIVDEETGEPLPGATVLLADASGGTSTNLSGNFSLNKLLIGTHRIIFSYVGYEPVYKTIEVNPGQVIREQVGLSQKPVDVIPVIVEAHQNKLPHANILNDPSDSDFKTVGIMKDAIRNLSLISGVQYGLPMSDLHLQGGQQSEHRILLDGIPVYNPTSFGQMFSSFSPYAIGKVTLHKAGFGAEVGSQIAGLINLSHDLPSKDEKGLILQADPLSANLRGDLSFSNQRSSSFNLMTAIRTNFWDIYKNPTFEQTLQNWNVIDPLIVNSLDNLDQDASAYSPIYQNSDIRFFDYHLATEYKIDPFTSISGSFYLGENRVETQLLNQGQNETSSLPYLYSTDYYKWNNYAAQVSLNQMPTPRLTLTTQASYSVNQSQHNNDVGITRNPGILQSESGNYVLDSFEESSFRSPLPTQIDGNNIQHFILKSDGSYSFTPHYSLQSGLQLDRVLTSIDISNLSYLPAQIDQSSTLFSSYLNSKHIFGDLWSLSWGSRFTYAAHADDIFIEPRFSLQFDDPDTKMGYWSARLSGGLYRQFINEYEITNTGSTAIVPSFTIWSLSDEEKIPKAWHLNSSFLLEPTENTSFKLEMFYKWQPIANITSYGNLNMPVAENSVNAGLNEIGAFAEATDIRSFGGGIQFSKSLAGPNIKVLAGYDYSFTRVNMQSQFGRSIPPPWNQPHRGQLRILWGLFSDFAISAKWQGIWRRSWAFRQSYYNYLRFQPEANSLPYSFNSPENDKLSPFHQVDLSFIYQPTIGTADLEMRVELINLLNRKNTLEKYLIPINYESDSPQYEVRERQLPGFYPTVSLQVKF